MFKVLFLKNWKEWWLLQTFLVFLFIQLDIISNDEINTYLPLTSKNIT